VKAVTLVGVSWSPVALPLRSVVFRNKELKVAVGVQALQKLALFLVC
jgi:hypothetical protein